MSKTIRIGLIGDRSDEVRAHSAIPRAFELIARDGGPEVAVEWLATDSLSSLGQGVLSALDGFWCVPGSPYASMDGALGAIRFAREHERPFLGTCGGFQHALIEVTRDVLGVREADHTESNPEASVPLIHRLACSLVGARGQIHIREGSLLARAYGVRVVVEAYHCNYGLNQSYLGLIESSPLRVVAVDDAGDVRAVELGGHAFFVATLFQPELSAFSDAVHPLLRAFAQAAADRPSRTSPARAGEPAEPAPYAGPISPSTG
jgi:CTP synthase (UTP-ammonia lyase)